MTDHTVHQEFERKWWGNCTNTFGEEAKQITYAHRMGLVNEKFGGWIDGDHVEGDAWPSYDMHGKSVLDIGGGPVSVLLKTRNAGRRVVVDPCLYPEWVSARYEAAGIEYVVEYGEHIDQLVALHRTTFDEVWIYNVLQHTMDPEKIIQNARAIGKVVRIFEWIDTPPTLGHPHTLTKENLDRWLGGFGQTEWLDGENTCHGLAYYGAF